MTETKLEPLLDYEDYCEDYPCDVDTKPKKILKTREKRNARKKRPCPAQNEMAFSFEKLIAERINEIREDVSKAQRRAMKNRDFSITKLRDDVHTDVRNIRKDKKSRILNKHRQIQTDRKPDDQQDEGLDSIFTLVWGFQQLTCFTKPIGSPPAPINVKKRKASPVDCIAYYDIPDRKINKLF